MKKYSLFLAFLIVFGSKGYAQEVSATSPPVSLMILGKGASVTALIRARVEGQMKDWQQKGKTETTAAYQARLTNRDAQVKIFTEAAIQEFKQKEIATTPWQFDHVNDYDADNATYRLSIGAWRYKDLVLSVPTAEVNAFDQAFQQRKLQFAKQDLILQGENWAIRYFEVTNLINRKTYVYDTQQSYVYNPTEFQFNFEPISVEVPNGTVANQSVVQPGKKVVVGQSDVDVNLPKTRMSNPDAIAVVIGNAAYTRTKQVTYAVADAAAVKKYLIEVLGYQEGNIFYKENATKTDFEELFGIASDEKGRLYNAVKPNLSDVFVFYAGHGAPGLNDKRGYFVPVNSDPTTINLTGYASETFYQNLAKIPARSVTVVLDACFSGADLLEGVSPIVVQSQGVRDIKNGALLASSTSDQVSAWYPEKQHGLFTYFFLKAIQSKAADANKDNRLTIREIHQYVSDRANGVPYFARRLRNVDQIPSLDGEDFDRVLVEY